jgi:hypothetical protein
MIRSLTLCSALTLVALANAQPVLTFAGNAPMPGTVYNLRYGPYVSEGLPGAGQTWDMTTLATDSMDVITLVDPATTTNGASFPTSTVAETGADAVMYFRSAADGMYLAGSDAAGLLIIYSDEGRYLPFPCNYADTWMDDVAAAFTVQTIDVSRSGTITGEVDGYGTLLMPTWSTSDVLRIHWHEETIDSTSLVNVVSVYDSYLYFVPGQSYPIVQLVHSEVTVFGQTTVEEHVQWVDELSTTTPESAQRFDGFSMFPIPATDMLNVTLPTSMQGTSTVTIADVQGRNVLRTVLGNVRGQVDVSTLAPGIYMLTAADANGTIATRRFVVE